MPQKNNPLFSIIVPAYNVENYLSECIESVLGQSYMDYELILVDDGSTDRTGEICDQYVKANSEHYTVKVIHQDNAGLSAARNTGIKEAQGEYLIFLDGDDYLEHTALKTIRDGLEPGLDLLRYQAQEVFADGKTVQHTETGFTTIPGVEAFPKLARYHYTENAWLYAYRREFFLKNGFTYAKGRLSEDFGLTPLIIARAKKVKAIPDICYNYRQRTGSIMHDTTHTTRRVGDMLAQLQIMFPELVAIPGTKAILHYLVVSFLSGATDLERNEFLRVHQTAKQKGMLQYIYPPNLRALPRSILLKHFPKTFYRVYHRLIL